MSEQPFPYDINEAVCLYDYIDSDGDLLDVSVVEGVWLVVTIIQHGKTAALSTILNEPDEARKIAAQLTAWADEMEPVS